MEMRWTEEQKEAFGVAINEATLLGAEVAPSGRAALTFAVLSLPEDSGPPPEDSRVQLILEGVSRVAASLRAGFWNDSSAEVILFELERLLEVVTGFKTPVYGWEFLDVPPEKNFASWENRLSLDWVRGPYEHAHTLQLFQAGNAPDRHLDLQFWLESIRAFRPTGEEIDFDEFTAGGQRWWDGLYAGDPRTADSGIQPMGPAA